MNCPDCRNPIQENAQTCEWCGVPLSDNNTNTANTVNSNDKPNLIKLLAVINKRTIWGGKYAIITFAYNENKSKIKGIRGVILKYQHNNQVGLIKGDLLGNPKENIIRGYFFPYNDESKIIFPLSQFATVELY